MWSHLPPFSGSAFVDGVSSKYERMSASHSLPRPITRPVNSHPVPTRVVLSALNSLYGNGINLLGLTGYCIYLMRQYPPGFRSGFPRSQPLWPELLARRGCLVVKGPFKQVRLVQLRPHICANKWAAVALSV